LLLFKTVKIIYLPVTFNRCSSPHHLTRRIPKEVLFDNDDEVLSSSEALIVVNWRDNSSKSHCDELINFLKRTTIQAFLRHYSIKSHGRRQVLSRCIEAY